MSGQATPQEPLAPRHRFATGLNWLIRGLVALICLIAVAFGLLGLRLSRGPLPVTRLAEHFLSRPAGLRLRFDAATLFWDWHAEQTPLVLQLHQAELRTGAGALVAQANRIGVGLAAGQLLLGRARPLFITVRQGSLALVRDRHGIVLAGQQPSRGSASDRTFSRLRTVSLAAVAVTLDDRVLAAGWQAMVGSLNVAGFGGPHPTGSGAVTLAQPGTPPAAVNFSLAGAPQGVRLVGTVAGLLLPHLPAPPDLANIFGMVAAPLSAGVSLFLSADGQPQSGDINLSIGRGTVGGGVGITGAGARVAFADVRHASLSDLNVHLIDGGTLAGSGTILRSATGAVTTGLTLGVDNLSFAGLSRVWPAAIAHDARNWVTTNITQGSAHEVTATLTLAFTPVGATLTSIRAHLTAEHLTLAWLSPAPPIVNASATLDMRGPDSLLVTVAHAEQASSSPDDAPLVITGATLRVTGLTTPVQTGVIDVPIAGPVKQLVALLREPRLHLLATHPMDLGEPSGAVSVRLHLSLPLEADVTAERIAVHATGALADLHLGGLVGGRDLDHGALGAEVTGDGLRLQGTAMLAGLPSTLRVGMDFRAGPPDQVTATYAASGRAAIEQLRAAGLPVGEVADGGIDYAVSVQEHRNGAGAVQVHIDLSGASLSLDALGWRKRLTESAAADAAVSLDHDRLVAVDHITVSGPSVRVEGHASYGRGSAVELVFDRLELGQTRATGVLRLPTAADAGLHADFHGPVLDLSSRMKPGEGRPVPSRAAAAAALQRRHAHIAAAKPQRGRRWDAALRFASVLLGPRNRLSDVVATASNDGLLVRNAAITGRAGQGGFRMTLTSSGQTRVLHGTASDAGSLLQALDLTGSVSGGTLAVDGIYDDANPDHPLSGTATVDRFRIAGAPAVARLLQAMTLYGVVDVLKGPGLGITHLVLPFRFADQVLGLDNARAFSGSLGFTAKGDIDLAAQRADLTGTIVPAYFFNTLLGRVPVLGKLFSPEKGGGLFAATYALHGPLGDPAVKINPLAALTPGVLRGLFGIFDRPAAGSAPVAPGS